MTLRNEQAGPSLIARGVDLNAVGDTFLAVGCNKFIVRRMTVFNASRTLAASGATIGAYTGAAAGGSLISTPATKVGLTTAAKWLDCTIAAPSTTDILTGTAGPATTNPNQFGIYIRVGVADGVATTCDVAFEIESLD